MATLRNGLGESGSTSGSGAVTVEVDFGTTFSSYTSVTVSGQTWVRANTVIVVTPFAGERDAPDVLLMDFRVSVADIVAGDGFTLYVYTPTEAKGTYYFNCVGGSS